MAAWVSGGALFVKPGAFSFGLADAFTGQIEAVRVVHEAVQNGIGDGRIGDGVMPVFDLSKFRAD